MTDRAVRSALSVFSTSLGWVGLMGDGDRDRVFALTFGHSTPVQVRLHLESIAGLRFDVPDADWSPDLRERLQAYALGAVVDFSDVEVDIRGLTTFRKNVVQALREVGYGQTVSYSELAALAGSPKAARAVGTAMSSNRVPIIVPCHRVVAEGHKLGGFSAPSGLSMKQRLLELEGVTHIRFNLRKAEQSLH
ncbi:MAG: methylated-DNA--[protein]-cysteine S-methyltransferase [Planctomycetaceae bacterium]